LAQDPPQSTSDSLPLRSLSSQRAGWHVLSGGVLASSAAAPSPSAAIASGSSDASGIGAGGDGASEQTRLIQSAPTKQVSPTAHGLQLPPQSIAVSAPSLRPFVHDESVQIDASRQLGAASSSVASEPAASGTVDASSAIDVIPKAESPVAIASPVADASTASISTAASGVDEP
jgi:hypothetical protein